MRYLPELLCSEVKPNSIYSKTDYISLLVKASILNGYAEGTSNVSRKLGKAPTSDTVLSYFKTMDRYELLSASSVVFEEQANLLRRMGMLNRPVQIAFDWHDQLFYGEKDSEMVNGIRSKNGSSYERVVLRLPVPHSEHPRRWKEADHRAHSHQEQGVHARLHR